MCLIWLWQTGFVPMSWLGSCQRSDGLTEFERDELKRLRKENLQLRTDREILGKAATFLPGGRAGDRVPVHSCGSRPPANRDRLTSFLVAQPVAVCSWSPSSVHSRESSSGVCRDHVRLTLGGTK